MTHPITPPPELVSEWVAEVYGVKRADTGDMKIAIRAAQWGADQELEACCEWVRVNGHHWTLENRLRAVRRPKPPSLKEQALAALAAADGADHPVVATVLTADQHAIIRRALEALPDA